MVNVLLRDEDDQFLQPTKVTMSVPKSDTAARAGLLFLVDSNISKDELNDWHNEFNGWTANDWKQWCEGDRQEDNQDVNLLTYFELEKDM